jgi:pyoverdine/dityrosine biosynthesis protein Dit1
MNKISQIAQVFKTYSLQEEEFHSDKIPLLKKIEQKIQNDQELIFILPAFPAKSPAKDKTNGELPDLGEVLALQNLNQLCIHLKEIHPAGARVIICSDGRVFSEVVKVSDESIDRYNDGIREIIADYDLKFLSVFTMEDIFPKRSPMELREILLDFYAADIEEIRELVLTNSNYRALFNGIHRFLIEDEKCMNSTDSKSAIQKETKLRAYELLRRSDAWSNLLNEHFGSELRLSIHPHPIGHEKFGIKLVPSSSKWATPWHNVTVKIKNQFELMHLKEALKLNAVLKYEKEKYAYFEVAAV